MINNKWYDIIFTQTGLILLSIILLLISIIFIKKLKSRNNKGLYGLLTLIILVGISFVIYNRFNSGIKLDNNYKHTEKLKKEINKDFDDNVNNINKNLETIEKLKQYRDSIKYEEICKNIDLEEASKKLKNL